MKTFLQLRHDLPASIVVFFVALPLCLGIALASGAPLFSGIIAGIVGGIIVGTLSGSSLGVSGPAAGLSTIVAAYIITLGSWESFLVVVIVAGVIQIIMGYLRLGTIAYYFPSSVIKGMLAGIGLTIIIKQFPYVLGYDSGFIEDSGIDDIAMQSPLLQKLNIGYKFITSGAGNSAILISLISIAVLVFWEKFLAKKHKIFEVISAPLVVIIVGITLASLFLRDLLPFSLKENQLVNIPLSESLSGFFAHFKLPDFNQFGDPKIYMMALVMAIIASLETLLSTEACDKIDPQKRLTPTNRELKAQGVGNIISGLIGGLPITQVIVRSSVNVTFGAKTKLSTIMHGIILLIAVMSIPKLLNMIPLASLACILLTIGYKLTKPTVYKQMYHSGLEQFLPFLATVIGMLAFDLLKGIGLGMVVAIGYIILNNMRNPFRRLEHKEKEKNEYIYKLAESVSFLNRGSILEMLTGIPKNSKLTIDGRHCKFIHHDVVEILRDFKVSAPTKNITFELLGIDLRKFKNL